MNTKALIVTGMHRSGTSAVAGGLKLLGVHMGNHLMPANPGENDRGFFEDVDLVELHDEILGALGRSWQDPRALPERWWELEEMVPFRERLGEHLRSTFCDSPLWAVKDPRLSRLLPLWLEVLEELECAPHVVMVTRNPLEVCDSLRRRNGFGMEKSLRLWLWHHLDAEAATRGCSRSVISYDEYLRDPDAAYRRLEQDFGIRFPVPEAGRAERLGDFVDLDLRHQRRETDRDPPEEGLEALALSLYALEVEDDGAAAGKENARSRIADDFIHKHPPGAELLREQLEEVQRSLAKERKTVRERTEWALQLEERASRLEKENRNQQKHNGSLRQEQKCVNAKCAFLKLRADEHRKWLLHVEECLAEARGDRDRARSELGRLSILHNEMVHSLSWSLTAPLRRLFWAWRNGWGGLAVSESVWKNRIFHALPGRFRRHLHIPLLRGELVLPRVERPRVSVVIPVHGKVEYTLRCLESICRASVATPYEVVVVDDASPDYTPGAMRLVGNLVYERNRENLGFIGSCNRGAELARGEVLVFLNNDTEVPDAWIDSLLDVFERHPDAGVVGAKLVYPDGTLQECGGIIWSDGDGWNYGRGGNPMDAEHMFVREVDYCSGACIAVPKALFESVGGFNPLYAPAYYEDTDLAFRVREEGYRVLVQPHCAVVHHEGISSGVDLSSGVKQYQRVNRIKFIERWRHRLAEHFEHDAVDPTVAMNRRHPRQVLFLDAGIVTPDEDSGSVRTFEMLRLLREAGCQVTYLPQHLQYVPKPVVNLQRAGVKVVHTGHEFSPYLFLEKHGGEFDMVIYAHDDIAAYYLPYLHECCRKAFKVYDTVDLHYLREEREAELLGDAGRKEAADKTKRREIDCMRKSDVTLVVSPVERDLLEREAPDVPVRILSNIFNPDPGEPGFASRNGMVFIGGFLHPPNVDAMLYFVREVMPELRKRLPGVDLTILGSHPPEQVRNLACEDVVVTGYVEDVKPFFDRARLSVAPMRFGAGVKGKINMSMSYGVPVVGSTVGCEGMYLEDGDTALIADAPVEMAEAIARLHTDQELWTRLRENGLEHMQRHFSTDAARSAVRELLTLADAKAGSGKRPSAPTGH